MLIESSDRQLHTLSDLKDDNIRKDDHAPQT